MGEPNMIDWVNYVLSAAALVALSTPRLLPRGHLIPHLVELNATTQASILTAKMTSAQNFYQYWAMISDIFAKVYLETRNTEGIPSSVALFSLTCHPAR